MDANLEFTHDEYNLLLDAKVFIHKSNITEKIFRCFGSLNLKIDLLKKDAAHTLPPVVALSGGKISRGENYESQPFVILDNPRVFDRHHVFAMRTLFLWGNFFTCTIHLSGKYLDGFRGKMQSYILQHGSNGYYICTGSDPWQHHLREDNYTPAHRVSQDSVILKAMEEKSFLKITLRIPLENYLNLEKEAVSFYSEFLKQY